MATIKPFAKARLTRDYSDVPADLQWVAEIDQCLRNPKAIAESERIRLEAKREVEREFRRRNLSAVTSGL